MSWSLGTVATCYTSIGERKLRGRSIWYRPIVRNKNNQKRRGGLSCNVDYYTRVTWSSEKVPVQKTKGMALEIRAGLQYVICTTHADFGYAGARFGFKPVTYNHPSGLPAAVGLCAVPVVFILYYRCVRDPLCSESYDIHRWHA